MRTAVLLIVGMLLAAIVAVAAPIAVETMALREAEKEEAPEVVPADAALLKSEMDVIEHRIQESTEQLAEMLDALAARTAELEKKIGELNAAIEKAREAGLAQASGAQPGAAGPVREVIKEALDEADKRREDRRTEERRQQMAGMQQIMKGMVTGRADQFAQQKKWDVTKTEGVKRILNDGMEKAGKIFEGFSGGMPTPEMIEKMREIMEETRTELLEVMTEEEVNEFFQNMPGPFGGRGGMPMPPAPDEQPGR